MPNPYHDETGRFCSKGEMGAAVDRLLESAVHAPEHEREGIMNQWFTLKNEYSILTTMDQLGVLPSDDADAPLAPVTSIASKQKQTIPAASKKQPEKKAPIAVPENSLALPARHTYEPAGGTSTPENSGWGGRNYVGSKYRQGQDILEVKRGVEKDIKEAIAKGYLPAHLDYNITTDRASMSESLIISIRGAKDKDIFTGSDDDWNGVHYSDDAREVSKRVEQIVEAYNYDNNNPQYDIYGHVDFYSHVRVESEREAEARKKDALIAKRRRQGLAYRKNLQGQVETAGSAAAYFEKNVKFNSVADGSLHFGVLDGPTPVVVVRHPARVVAGRSLPEHYATYDLSSFDPEGPLLSKGDLNKSLAQYSGLKLQRTLAKGSFELNKRPRRRRA